MTDSPRNATERTEKRAHIGSYVQKGGINPDPKSQIKERPAPPKPIRTSRGTSPGKKTEKK